MSDFPEVVVKEEYEEIRRWAKDFGQREIAAIAEKLVRTDEYSLDLARKMGEYGLVGLSIPQEYGGLGLRAVRAVIVAEEIDQGRVCGRLSIGVHNARSGNAVV